jgi:hypothetical protein
MCSRSHLLCIGPANPLVAGDFRASNRRRRDTIFRARRRSFFDDRLTALTVLHGRPAAAGYASVVGAGALLIAPLAFQQPPDIYAVLLGELSDLVMLERQRRLDLFVGKIARCSYVPDALPHRLFELASARHRFAVGPTHRMSGEKCQIGGDRAFDPFGFSHR